MLKPNCDLSPTFSLFLHIVIEVNASRHSSFPQHGLQFRDLVQTRSVLDHILQPLLLLVRQLDPRHPRRETAGGAVGGRGSGNVKGGARLDAHDGLGQLGRLGRRAEELNGAVALGLLDLLVVEEAHSGAAPEHPVPVVLNKFLVSMIRSFQKQVALTVPLNSTHLLLCDGVVL